MKEKKSSNTYEMFLWLIFFVLLTTPLVLIILKHEITVERLLEILQLFYFHLIFFSIVIVGLVVFYRTFGFLPIGYFGRKFKQAQIEKENLPQYGEIPNFNDDETFKYQKLLILESKRLAEKTYKNANINLAGAIFISLLSVILIYSQTFDMLSMEEVLHYLRVMLPKTSIILILELKALLMFRQYRINMNEFRYYEQIVRDREGSLTMFSLLINTLDVKDPDKISELSQIFRETGIIDQNKKSIFYDSQKIDSDELKHLANRFIPKNIPSKQNFDPSKN